MLTLENFGDSFSMLFVWAKKTPLGAANSTPNVSKDAVLSAHASGLFPSLTVPFPHKLPALVSPWPS